MKHQLKIACWIGCIVVALGFVGLSAVLSPVAVVDRVLPAEYQSYRESLIRGLGFLRLVLLVDAVLCAVLPMILRLFPRISWPGLPRLTKGEVVAVLGLTGVALGVRLLGMRDGFGYDETFVFQSLMTKSIPAIFSRAEPWRALYGLLGFISCRLLGPSEFSARLPSLVFGVLAVPAVYLLARGWFGRGAATVSALLLTLSTFHTWYSHDASSYAMVFFSAVVSVWALPRAVERDNSFYWLAWVLATFVAFYGHWYIGGVLLAGQGLHLLIMVVTRKTSPMALVRSGAGVVYVVAAVLTMASVAIPRQLEVMQVWEGAEERGPLLANLLFFCEWLFHSYASVAYRVCYAAIFVCGALVSLRRDWRRTIYILYPTIILLAHWAYADNKILCLRYGILTLIPVTVFAGVGVCAVARIVAQSFGATRRRIVNASVAMILVLPLFLGGVTSLKAYRDRERYPIRPMAVYVNDAIPVGAEVYFGGFGYDKFSFHSPSLKHLAEYDELRALLRSGSEFWLVYWFPNYLYGMPDDVRVEFESRAELMLQYTALQQSYSEHDYEAFCWRVRGGER